MSSAHPKQSESTILARIFGDKLGQLPPEMAHYILDLDFNERDKARIHDLVNRNQEDLLDPTEKEELHAFLNAGVDALDSPIEGPPDSGGQSRKASRLLMTDRP